MSLYYLSADKVNFGSVSASGTNLLSNINSSIASYIHNRGTIRANSRGTAGILDKSLVVDL